MPQAWGTCSYLCSPRIERGGCWCAARPLGQSVLRTGKARTLRVLVVRRTTLVRCTAFAPSLSNHAVGGQRIRADRHLATTGKPCACAGRNLISNQQRQIGIVNFKSYQFWALFLLENSFNMRYLIVCYR